MRIDVTAALNRPGKTDSFECSKTIKTANIAGEEVEFVSPVKVSGTLMYTGEDYIVKGNAEVKYKTSCSRCMKELTYDMSFDFYEEYSKVEDDDHPDRYLFENNEIDLEEMVINNISLTMPMKHICDEECKGLCGICGKNLNNETCSCVQDEKFKSSPFAKIKGMSFEDED